MQREVIAAATSTYPNGQVDDGAESDLLAEELIAAEPVTITGTESPGNKGTPPAGVLEADGRRKDGRWRRGSVVNPCENDDGDGEPLRKYRL